MSAQLVVGISGFELTAEEVQLLQQPNVSGVLLFARNYHDKQQLTELTTSIHQLRANILIYVDQEGGRIQRFTHGFTPLPAAATFGELYLTSPNQALYEVEAHAYLMAAELKACGVDISFAPVLDIQGISEVIGDRAFSEQVPVIIDLARSWVDGMHRAGMIAVGKHFPGHGSVKADTHVTTAIDVRSASQISAQDLLPFQALIESGIDALMMSHVIYRDVDDKPASFSVHWIQTVLRQQLGFRGTIYSDDLGMVAATEFASLANAVDAADHAGCDHIIVANESVDAIYALR